VTTSAPEPPDPRLAGRLLDAGLHLLDRQVLDLNDSPVTAVDDLELTDVPFGVPIAPGSEAPVITALLSGPVLVTRIFGGRPPRSRLNPIPWSSVFEVGVVIRLAVRGDSLDLTWTERWVRDRIIGRIPGGRHDPD
jgi:hypothetical protein